MEQYLLNGIRYSISSIAGGWLWTITQSHASTGEFIASKSCTDEARATFTTWLISQGARKL